MGAFHLWQMKGCNRSLAFDSYGATRLKTDLLNKLKEHILKQPTKITAPDHLRPETKGWWLNVIDEYALEPHHVRLLTLACESYDRATVARETIASQGLYFTDRFGAPRKHPAVSVAESATIAFARLTRELDLDCGSHLQRRHRPLPSNRIGGTKWQSRNDWTSGANPSPTMRELG